MGLEPFSHPPFGGVILSHDLDVPLLPPVIVIDGKNDLLSAGLHKLDNAALLVDFESNIAAFPKSIDFPLHPGSFQIRGVDWESGEFLELQLFGDGQADHVFLFAVQAQVMLRLSVLDAVNSIEVFISIRILCYSSHSTSRSRANK